MNYGLPYKGSKNKIANWVCDILPNANTLYDLFAGGGAITHYSSLNNKYKNYIVNDLNPLCIKGFKMALNGEFKNEKRWISREDFFKLKETDYYATCCYSFGNDFESYACKKNIEQYKKALHYSVFFNDNSLLSKFVDVTNLEYTSDVIQDRMRHLRKYLSDFKDKNILLENLATSQQSLKSLERLERLQGLERLERLQGLNNLQKDNIKFYSDDYQNIPLTDEKAIIYCDIPYKNTSKYKFPFNYERFYLWAEKQEIPIYISEYQMPKDRFICVAEKEKRCILSSANNSKITIERIFRPRTQL